MPCLHVFASILVKHELGKCVGPHSEYAEAKVTTCKMARGLIVLVAAISCLLVASSAARSLENIVYWGQNSASGSFPSKADYEKPLSVVCEKNYTTIILGFLDIFFDPRNPGQLPGINFADHCGTLFDKYVSLFHCPEIGYQIKVCQSKQKRVMISLGGAVGLYGFSSDDQAEQFATTIWNMFLGGKDPNVPRPFDSTILDGIDLDIEASAKTGYVAFVKKIRALMTASDNQYYISAAPQCPFPDAHLGPSQGTPLQDAITAVDFLNVQFYNNYCKYTEGSTSDFIKSWKQWSSLQTSNPKIKILVGLYADPKGNGYVNANSLPNLFKLVNSDPAFGGAMVWDAAWSQNNLVSMGNNTIEYSEAVYRSMN